MSYATDKLRLIIEIVRREVKKKVDLFILQESNVWFFADHSFK
jgi:hypothetical protein